MNKISSPTQYAPVHFYNLYVLRATATSSYGTFILWMALSPNQITELDEY